MKKSKIELGVKGDQTSFSVLAQYPKSKGSVEFYQATSAPADIEDRVKPAELINRNSHPITLSYDGEALVLPPRGREIIGNLEKLGGLAPGVTCVPKRV